MLVHFKVDLKPIWCLAILLLLSVQGSAEPLFEVSNIKVQRTIKHPVIAAFLSNPDQANLLVREFSDDGGRFITTYAMHDQHHVDTEEVDHPDL